MSSMANTWIEFRSSSVIPEISSTSREIRRGASSVASTSVAGEEQIGAFGLAYDICLKDQLSSSACRIGIYTAVHRFRFFQNYSL